jgi:hypothetical protein
VNLTIPVNPSDTLLKVHWIPRQITIEKYAGELQVRDKHHHEGDVEIEERDRQTDKHGDRRQVNITYERREPLREYIVRENRPSYRYEDEVAVGRELPRGAYESYEVPEEYGIREHHYAIINGRPVIFHPQTRRIVHIYD